MYSFNYTGVIRQIQPYHITDNHKGKSPRLVHLSWTQECLISWPVSACAYFMTKRDGQSLIWVALIPKIKNCKWTVFQYTVTTWFQTHGLLQNDNNLIEATLCLPRKQIASSHHSDLEIASLRLRKLYLRWHWSSLNISCSKFWVTAAYVFSLSYKVQQV